MFLINLRTVADVEAKKREPAVYLLINEKLRKAVRDIDPTELGGDNGAEIILLKLDQLYLKDCNTRTYAAFNEFLKYKKSSGEDFANFIRFEQLYSKLAEYYIVLQEVVQVDFLLSAVNVSEDNEKLARTMCNISDYTHMKNTSMKIFMIHQEQMIVEMEH